MKQSFTKLFVAFLALLLAPNWAVAENYSLYVQNKGASTTDIIQVSSDNAANILAGDAINDGKLIYNASTKTLTIKAGVDIQRINNFSIEDQAGVADLTIYVEGNAEVNHIYTCSNTTITGPGKLTMTDPASGNTGSYAIELGPTQPVLTIKDADVEITYPIPTEGAIKNKDWQSPGTLVINNSNVTISTTYQETSQTGRVIQLESEPTLINCAITSPESVTWGEDNEEYLCYLNNNSPVGEIVITATGGGSLGSFSYQTTSTGGLQFVSNSYAPAFFNMEILSEPNGNEPGTVRISGPGKPSGNTQYLADYAINNGYTGSVKLEKEIVHDSKTYKVVEIESLQGFTQITSITIPSTITTISATAFDGCTGLQDITIEGSKPTIIGTEANLFNGIADNPVLTIPKWDTTWDAIYAAKAWGAPTWSSIAYIAPKGTCGAYIWMDDNGDIVDPQNRTNRVEVRINAYADYTAEITALRADIPDAKSKFTIPTSLTVEGLDWANGTYEIKQVNAGALSNSNYTNDAIIEELVIPSGIKIEDGAFTNLSGLKKVTFEDGCVKSDYGNIFSNITSSASLEADPQSPVILICPNTWENVANNWAGGNWRVLASDEILETITIARVTTGYNPEDLRVVYKITDANNKYVSFVDLLDVPTGEYKNYVLTIPNTTNDGYTVTQLGTGVFNGIDWLFSIIMPSGLVTVADNAIVNMTNLNYVSFENVEASQGTFDYGAADVKFSNNKYSESAKTRFIKPDSWDKVWDDWGGGTATVWAIDASNVKEVIHWGVFIDDVEITNKNVEEYEENDVNIYENHLLIQSDVEWGSMRIENVDEDNDEPFVIVIPEENTVTLTSGLVCNMDVIISGDGTLNVSSNSGATVQIADGKNLTIGDDQSNVIPIVNITNTGGYACVSGGTESSLGFYKANVTMETSGETLISGVEAPTLSACVVTDGGFDESSVTIEPGLGVGAVVTNYFMNDDNEYLDGYYTVTGLSPMIASFGNAISGGVSGEKPDEIEAESWDLTVPETVTDIDTQTDLAVTSVQYGLMGTDYVNSLTLPKTITSILAPAISNVTNFKKLTLSNGTSSTLISNIAENAFVSVSTGVANENPVLGIPYDWDESDLPGWDADSKTATLGGVTWDVEKNALFDIGEIATQTVQVTGENGGTLDLIYTITKLPTDTENGQVFVYKPYMPNDISNIMDFGEVAYENPQPADVVGAVTLEPTVTIKGYTFDVVAVGANAFCEMETSYVPCPHISSITFPESIKNIYCFAFTENKILKSVTFKGGRVENTYEFMGMEDFCDAFDGVDATLTVPASWGLVADDWNAGTWTSINYVKEVELDENGNEVETTPVNFAVADADKQTMEVTSSETLAEEGTIVIPQTMALGDNDFTVTAIGDGAFENQTNLTGVTLPKTIESIGAGAFTGCTGLQTVTLQSPFAPTIGTGAFDDNADLTVNYPAAAYNNYNDAGWTGVATFQPTVMQPNEWSTICSTQDYTLPEGIEAYIVVGIDYENSKVQVKKEDGIKANTPMMIHKTGVADDYAVTASNITISDTGDQLPTTVADAGTTDAFVGFAPASADETLSIPDGSGAGNTQAYILVGNSFVRWTSGTLAPYRCFLWATQSFGAPSRMAIEIVDEEATGISDVTRLNVNDKVYDLQGRRVTNTAKKGVYIVDGKKIIK